LQVDLMPDEAVGANIAEAFAEFESVENLKICIFRAEVANPELPAALEALGAIVDDIPLYRTVAETDDVAGLSQAIREHGADWLTFASSSTVQHFHARFDLPVFLQRFPETKIASIGPETSRALATLEIKPTVEAKEHTIDGLVASILAKRS
jgi:uroporphyrinogen III methyltransferase/synthase